MHSCRCPAFALTALKSRTIRKQRVAAQIEKWEENCDRRRFRSLLRRFMTFMTPQSPLQRGANVVSTAPNVGETLAFLTGPYDLKVFKSFKVLCIVVFFSLFSFKTSSCRPSVMLPYSRIENCNIENGTKHKPTRTLLHSTKTVATSDSVSGASVT